MVLRTIDDSCQAGEGRALSICQHTPHSVITMTSTQTVAASLPTEIRYARIEPPKNLDIALEGLVKRILKEQPRSEDIYNFAANHFETLLRLRDYDEKSAQENDVYDEDMFKLAKTFAKPLFLTKAAVQKTSDNDKDDEEPTDIVGNDEEEKEKPETDDQQEEELKTNVEEVVEAKEVTITESSPKEEDEHKTTEDGEPLKDNEGSVIQEETEGAVTLVTTGDATATNNLKPISEVNEDTTHVDQTEAKYEEKSAVGTELPLAAVVTSSEVNALVTVVPTSTVNEEALENQSSAVIGEPTPLVEEEHSDLAVSEVTGDSAPLVEEQSVSVVEEVSVETEEHAPSAEDDGLSIVKEEDPSSETLPVEEQSTSEVNRDLTEELTPALENESSSAVDELPVSEEGEKTAVDALTEPVDEGPASVGEQPTSAVVEETVSEVQEVHEQSSAAVVEETVSEVQEVHEQSSAAVVEETVSEVREVREQSSAEVVEEAVSEVQEVHEQSSAAVVEETVSEVQEVHEQSSAAVVEKAASEVDKVLEQPTSSTVVASEDEKVHDQSTSAMIEEIATEVKSVVATDEQSTSVVVEEINTDSASMVEEQSTPAELSIKENQVLDVQTNSETNVEIDTEVNEELLIGKESATEMNEEPKLVVADEPSNIGNGGAEENETLEKREVDPVLVEPTISKVESASEPTDAPKQSREPSLEKVASADNAPGDPQTEIVEESGKAEIDDDPSPVPKSIEDKEVPEGDISDEIILNDDGEIEKRLNEAPEQVSHEEIPDENSTRITELSENIVSSRVEENSLPQSDVVNSGMLNDEMVVKEKVSASDVECANTQGDTIETNESSNAIEVVNTEEEKSTAQESKENEVDPPSEENQVAISNGIENTDEETKEETNDAKTIEVEKSDPEVDHSKEESDKVEDETKDGNDLQLASEENTKVVTEGTKDDQGDIQIENKSAEEHPTSDVVDTESSPEDDTLENSKKVLSVESTPKDSSGTAEENDGPKEADLSQEKAEESTEVNTQDNDIMENMFGSVVTTTEVGVVAQNSVQIDDANSGATGEFLTKGTLERDFDSFIALTNQQTLNSEQEQNDSLEVLDNSLNVESSQSEEMVEILTVFIDGEKRLSTADILALSHDSDALPQTADVIQQTSIDDNSDPIILQDRSIDIEELAASAVNSVVASATAVVAGVENVPKGEVDLGNEVVAGGLDNEDLVVGAQKTSLKEESVSLGDDEADVVVPPIQDDIHLTFKTESTMDTVKDISQDLIPTSKDKLRSTDDEVIWSTLEKEMDSAAATIQHSYKAYKNRQRLRREDAVQMTMTSEDNDTDTDSVVMDTGTRLLATGELHDTIIPMED